MIVLGPFLKIFIAYLVLINIVSVIVTIIDKRRAKKDQWRIKESTLLLLSAIGGCIGMYITMRLIHHKTRKFKFMIGIPMIFILQILALLLFLFLR